MWVGFHHARLNTAIEFVIWTGDKGMDDAFRTIIGRKISRRDPRPIKGKKEIKQIVSPNVEQSVPTGKQTISVIGNRCIELLRKAEPVSRPRKKSTLVNNIQHWKNGINFPQQPEQIFDWLMRKGIISVGKNEKISYNLG